MTFLRLSILNALFRSLGRLKVVPGMPHVVVSFSWHQGLMQLAAVVAVLQVGGCLNGYL